MTISEATRFVREHARVLGQLDELLGTAYKPGEASALRLADMIDMIRATCEVNLARPDTTTGHAALRVILSVVGASEPKAAPLADPAERPTPAPCQSTRMSLTPHPENKATCAQCGASLEWHDGAIRHVEPVVGDPAFSLAQIEQALSDDLIQDIRFTLHGQSMLSVAECRHRIVAALRAIPPHQAKGDMTASPMVPPGDRNPGTVQ